MAFGGFDERRGQQPMAEINTTPLVDVMLVLLVIFIITAPLMTYSIRLDLPNVRASAATEPTESINLSIDAAGVVYWNNEAVSSSADLEKRLIAAARSQPQPPVQLRADRDTRYQTIAEVMSAIQLSGISRIGFVTDPGPGRGEPAGARQ
jgi:biopolymer transport protein ExbD